MNPKRRYEALVARARDQKGTPEGATCERLAGQMRRRFPELLECEEDLPVSWHEVHWKTWDEELLLQAVARYLDVKVHVYSPRPGKRLLFEIDEPTFSLLVHAYLSLKDKVRQVALYAAGGFLVGALPVAREPDDEDEGNADGSIDQDLLETAASAVRMGRKHQTRTALNPSGEQDNDDY